MGNAHASSFVQRGIDRHTADRHRGDVKKDAQHIITDLAREHGVRIRGTTLGERQNAITAVIDAYDRTNNLPSNWSIEAIAAFRKLLGDLLAGANGNVSLVTKEIMLLSLRGFAAGAETQIAARHSVVHMSGKPLVNPLEVLEKNGFEKQQAIFTNFDGAVEILLKTCWPWIDTHRFFYRKKITEIDRTAPVKRELRVAVACVYKTFASINLSLGTRFADTFAYGIDQLQEWSELPASQAAERAEEDRDPEVLQKMIVREAVRISGLERSTVFSSVTTYVMPSMIDRISDTEKRQAVEVWLAIADFAGAQNAFSGLYKIPQSLMQSWMKTLNVTDDAVETVAAVTPVDLPADSVEKQSPNTPGVSSDRSIGRIDELPEVTVEPANNRFSDTVEQLNGVDVSPDMTVLSEIDAVLDVLKAQQEETEARLLEILESVELSRGAIKRLDGLRAKLVAWLEAEDGNDQHVAISPSGAIPSSQEDVSIGMLNGSVDGVVPDFADLQREIDALQIPPVTAGRQRKFSDKQREAILRVYDLIDQYGKRGDKMEFMKKYSLTALITNWKKARSAQ